MATQLHLETATRSRQVPAPLVLYAALSLGDLGFSILAFLVGYREANPALAWALNSGVFLPAKLAVTQMIILIGYLLWRHQPIRNVLHLANAVMCSLFIYHVSFWAAMITHYGPTAALTITW